MMISPRMFALVIFAGVLGLPDTTSARDYVIQVTIHHVRSLADFDRRSEPDFFATLNIAGSWERTRMINHRGEIRPRDWSHWLRLDGDYIRRSYGGVPIDIGLRDGDDDYGEDYDKVDISPHRGIYDLHLALAVEPGRGPVLIDRQRDRPLAELRRISRDVWSTGRLYASGRHARNDARIVYEVRAIAVNRWR